MTEYPVRKRIRKIGNSNFLLIPSYFFEQGVLEEGQEISITIHIPKIDDNEVQQNEESYNRPDDN